MPNSTITREQTEALSLSGDGGEGRGACLTAPGSHPTDQTPSGSGGDAVSIPSRAEILAALEPWARAARGIPDEAPGDLWTHCDSWPYDLPQEIQDAIAARGVRLADIKSNLSLWIDGYPLSDFRRAAEVYEKLANPAFAAAIPSDGKDINPDVDLCEPRPVRIDYVNWRGERSQRRILPTGRLIYGATEWHPRHQWLLEAMDLEKSAVRLFAFEDMQMLAPSVSDRSGEAVETTGSTEGKSTADLSATPEPPLQEPKNTTRQTGGENA